MSVLHYKHEITETQPPSRRCGGVCVSEGIEGAGKEKEIVDYQECCAAFDLFFPDMSDLHQPELPLSKKDRNTQRDNMP